MSDDSRCINCGKCCHGLENKKLKKCAFLKILPDGTTTCRRYRTRLGTIISKHYKCGMRCDSKFDYSGCPLNTDKPISW